MAKGVEMAKNQEKGETEKLLKKAKEGFEGEFKVQIEELD